MILKSSDMLDDVIDDIILASGGNVDEIDKIIKGTNEDNEEDENNDENDIPLF